MTTMAKRTNRLDSALLPWGLVALVAGCGGGSVVSAPTGSTYVPPGPSSQGVGTAGTAKATLTLYVPPRRPRADGRHPSYISPGTSTVSVSVFPAGMATPWPNPTVTSVPTMNPSPGPTPTAIPVTMTLNAPLGNAQFFVNTYDSNGVLLSGALSSPAPISGTATNTVTLTLNASAQCMQINHGNSGVTFVALSNQTVVQSATFTVTPCDIDGYAIGSGQLANALTFTSLNPNPSSVGRRAQDAGSSVLSFSPSSISAGGDTTVTATYAVGATTVGRNWIVPSPVAAGVTPQNLSISVTPSHNVLVSNRGDDTVSVFAYSNNGSLLDSYSAPLAAGAAPSFLVGAGPSAGCAQGGQAAAVNDGTHSVSVLTQAIPGSMNATPAPPAVTTTISGLPAAASTAAGIVGCDVYIGSNGFVSTLKSQMSSLAASIDGPFSNPYDGSSQFTYGTANVTAVGGFGTGAYVGLGLSSGSHPNNLENTANTFLYPGFAPSTDAIAPYDATDVALAYHSPSDGYLHFALFDGTKINPGTDNAYTGFNPTVIGMSVDPNGNLWAITSSNLLEYTPSTGVTSSFTLSGLYPSAIAVDKTGTIFVTDTNGGAANGLLYSYYCGGCNPPPPANTGKNPSGIAILP